MERFDEHTLKLPDVVDAQWHPLALDTMVALTAHGQLQVYKLDRSGAELGFALQGTYSPMSLNGTSIKSTTVNRKKSKSGNDLGRSSVH